MPTPTITPTEHEKAEWSRMAQDCYRHDLNDFGLTFSMASAMCLKGQAIPLARFYHLQGLYRMWLTVGVSALPRN
jgi:hypothetical protein